MQQKMRIITIVVVLGITTVGAIFWFQRYLLRSRASSTPLATFAITEGKKVLPGDSFDLVVQINPNLKRFYSFDLSFAFDPTKVMPKNNIDFLSNIASASSDVALLSNGTGMTVNLTSHQGKVHVSGIRNTGNGDPFIGNTPIPLVKISFTMKADAALPFEFTWDTASKTDLPSPDSLVVENLNYTGIDPTSPAGATAIPAVGVPTSTPIPGLTTQPTRAQGGGIVPAPTIMGASGKEGTTTAIRERQDLLYINSIATYQSPFRYEQILKLEKGTYSLLIGAKIYVRYERGVVLALICNETTCGAKKKNEILYVSPVFPVKAGFSEMADSIVIPDNADNKEYILRVFCEDGSECDIDYISLEDAWGSQRLKNTQFAEVQSMIDPRLQPSSWEVDSTANMYGSIDPLFGVNGALMINNPAK